MRSGIGKEGIAAIGGFIGWYTYLKSGEPFSEYKGTFPDFPTTIKDVQKLFGMFGRGDDIDDFKDMLVDVSLEPQDLINAISSMSPVEFMDFYEDPLLHPALSMMAGGDPEGLYTAIKSGNTAPIAATITPHMDQLKQGLKEMSLVDILTLLPGLGDSRGMGEALSELFRGIMDSDSELAGMLAEFVVGSAVEFGTELAEIMADHGDPAWKDMLERATSVQAQKQPQPGIEYHYTYTPEKRNILTDNFNASAMDIAHTTRRSISRPGVMSHVKELTQEMLTEFERSTLESDHDYIKALYIKAYDRDGNLEERYQDTPDRTKTILNTVLSLSNMIDNTYRLNKLADLDKDLETGEMTPRENRRIKREVNLLLN